jgi:ABC-type glycerol-3-phosphate transport system substrate-binding protein
MFNMTMVSFGGSMLDVNLEKAAFHSPEGVAALEYYVDLVRRRQVSPIPWPEPWKVDTTVTPATNGLDNAFLMANNGGVAMRPLQTFSVNAVKKFATFRWQAVLPPRRVRMASHQGGGNWYMVKAAPHRDQARELFAQLTSPEEEAIWAVSQQRLPPQRRAVEHPIYQGFLAATPELRVHWDTAQGAVGFPAVVGWTDVAPVLQRAIGEFLLGNVTPSAALQDAARQADAILEQARASAM